MSDALAWCMLVAGILVVTLIAVAVVRYYADPSERVALTTWSTAIAWTLALACVMLVPVDIYIVSSSTNSEGLQNNPSATADNQKVIKVLYYTLYSLALAFAFGVLPFAYFYFEEESDHDSSGTRACTAIKYTLGFLVAFGVLLGIGVVLHGSSKFDGADEKNNKWIDNLKSEFSAGDSVITFCVAVLSTIGLLGWIMYTPCGLALFPISMIRSRGDENLGRSAPVHESQDSNAENELAAVQSQIDFLQKKEQLSSSSSSSSSSSRSTWSLNDQKELENLRRKEKQLLYRAQQNRAKVERRAQASSSSSVTCAKRCQFCWNAFAPLRIVVGMVLLAAALLITLSLLLTSIDKVEHSECKAECGYTLSKPDIVNPLDEALKVFSQAFPIDLILFGAMVIFLFLCTMTAMVILGVRLLIWKLYDIRRKRTMPHALIFGAWLILFTVLLFNMQIITLTPQYATFGNQFYIEHRADNSTAKMKCDTAHVTNGTQVQCVMTELAKFINTTQLALPFFGVIFFYSNWIFIGMFIIAVIYATFRKIESSQYEALMEAEDLER